MDLQQPLKSGFVPPEMDLAQSLNAKIYAGAACEASAELWSLARYPSVFSTHKVFMNTLWEMQSRNEEDRKFDPSLPEIHIDVDPMKAKEPVDYEVTISKVEPRKHRYSLPSSQDILSLDFNGVTDTLDTQSFGKCK